MVLEDVDSPVRESATAPESSLADAENGSSSSPPPSPSPPPPPPPPQRRKTPTKLYVGNLSAKVGAKDLGEMFQKYGRVSDVDVLGSFAFVVMPDESEAEEAIKDLHERPVDGKKLVVEKKKAKAGGGTGRGRQDPRNRGGEGRTSGNHRHVQLFVAKCREISEEQLTETFSRFGNVVGVQKPTSKPDIAFVVMETFFEARKAIEQLNKKPVEGLGGRSVFVQLATNNNATRDGRPLQALLERGETIKLFVGNLAEGTDAKALGLLFERFGPVFDVAVVKDKNFGFVHMLTRESAEDAVRALNRRDFNGANISVMFSVKKGMSIANQAPGAAPHMSSFGDGGGGRLGARTMMPRIMNRGDAGSYGGGGGGASSRGGDVMADSMVDPLLALQQQINCQYLSGRSSAFAPLANSLSGFPFDALFPRNLPSFHPYGAASPRRQVDSRFSANAPAAADDDDDDRSRYANFAATRTSPFKRGRSPVRSLQRLSPSPKRNFLDNDLRNGLSRTRSPRRDLDFGTTTEPAMRRNSAKSVPPKMIRPRLF